ncbi:hypothetical protein [Saccharolobus solfataricus]|uniref:hypothetical protein n=1 Tax=Saccharolobus solfataricus TaxID=2287 RepID=UPI0001C3866F|nr:hypothetical protein [Saccharolobus solfataricus]
MEKFLDYDLVVYPLPKAINFLKALTLMRRRWKNEFIRDSDEAQGLRIKYREIL